MFERESGRVIAIGIDMDRYIQKFHQMRTQLQAVSLRIQTVRSNEQMMQSMKGATQLLGNMNRSMRLPALQKIAMEFEKENDIMDQRQEMMDDAIDDVTGVEDEEEGEEVIKEVLDEIGVDLGQAVRGVGNVLRCLNPLSNLESSSARLLRGCKATPSKKDVLRRRLAVVVLETMRMICKPAWMDFDGNDARINVYALMARGALAGYMVQASALIV